MANAILLLGFDDDDELSVVLLDIGYLTIELLHMYKNNYNE